MKKEKQSRIRNSGEVVLEKEAKKEQVLNDENEKENGDIEQGGRL